MRKLHMAARKKGELPVWLTLRREADFARLKTWPFWRTMIIYFCVFSIVGHMVEYPYCWLGMKFFGTVDPTSEVLANPFKPFFVYGIGIVFCCVLLEPFKSYLHFRIRNPKVAMFVFYVISVFLGMGFELGQGFLQNQPVDGVYPLWDVSTYPGNILGQAWIVNDVLIGLIITVIVWIVLPPCNYYVSHLDADVANLACFLIVVGTAILTFITYT